MRRFLSHCVTTAFSLQFGVALSVPAALALPPGFQETTALQGLQGPTAVRFTRNGDVFVAQRDGVVLRFDGLDDTTPTIVADLHRSVSNFSERGMLGMAIDPGYNRASDQRLYLSDPEHLRRPLPGGRDAASRGLGDRR